MHEYLSKERIEFLSIFCFSMLGLAWTVNSFEVPLIIFITCTTYIIDLHVTYEPGACFLVYSPPMKLHSLATKKIQCMH